MDELEAVGDAVTGGVIAAAVEPATGDAGHTQETHCLNCGAKLLGPYCSMCGQHAHVHRTLKAFWHDLLHGAFHFEGKIWDTLPLLVWKPGELTRRYIEGHRARYVSPIALFLFFVFMTFAVMTLTGRLGAPTQEARKDIAQELRTDQLKMTSLQATRDKLSKSGLPTANLDDQITDLRTEIGALQAVGQKNLPVGNLDIGGADGVPGWAAKAIASAKENPELVLFKIKTNAYKFSWALIPISVPFVWLLFPFSRRFGLYDHTIFVTYSLSFMMLLLVAVTLGGLVAPGLADFAWFVPPIHMYRQLRGAYGVGKWGAVWRTMALTVFAFIAIGLFTSLLVALGAFE